MSCLFNRTARSYKQTTIIAAENRHISHENLQAGAGIETLRNGGSDKDFHKTKSVCQSGMNQCQIAISESSDFSVDAHSDI